jgi:hypothetical protein
MIEIRKTITLRETVFSELGVEAARPITRAVGMAVIRNPFAGQFVEDLRPLFEAGAMLGERLMPELVKLLDGPAISYGKGAIVGVAGEMEHGGACGPPDARETDAGGDRRRKSGDRIECEGSGCGRFARRAARAQRRFLVIPAFRHNHCLSSRCTATRGDPDRDDDC